MNSLALYRVALGLVLLYDTIYRWTDLTAHYTEDGTHSIEAAQGITDFSFSLHFLIDANWWPALLFAVQAFAALTLIVGYRTRLSLIISWILLVSVQNRNTLLLNGGDVLLRVQLFWSIFLPLNRRFSVDIAHLKVAKTMAKTAYSPATVAIVVQSVLLYAQTAALKTSPTWNENYEALYFALSAEQFSSPLGVWATQYRTLMEAFTLMAIRIEQIVPILLLNPLMNHWSRGIAFLMIAGLHVGIIALMTVGIFPWIGIITVIPLIPGAVWDYLGRVTKYHRPAKTLTVYYDNSCGICQVFIRYLSAFGFTHSVKVKNIYEYKTIRAKSDKYNSWVGRADGKYMYRADVFIEILKRSYVWWPLAYIVQLRPIHFIATKIYLFVSSNRHSVCKPYVAKHQSPLRAYLSKLSVVASGIAVTGILLTVIFWVRSDMPGVSSLKVTGPYRDMVRHLRLDQHWNMFSPTPITFNSWVIVEASTPNGTIDLWRQYRENDSTLSYDRPEHSYDTYVNMRWRRLVTRIQDDGYSNYRADFLNYMCSEWRRDNPDEPVVKLDLIQMYEETELNPDDEVIARNNISSIECR